MHLYVQSDAGMKSHLIDFLSRHEIQFMRKHQVSISEKETSHVFPSAISVSDCMELTVKAFECRRENHFHSEAFRLRLAIEFKTETFPPLAENVKLTLIFI